MKPLFVLLFVFIIAGFSIRIIDHQYEGQVAA